MNVVNFSDGVDGLAAGVCAIIAAAMAVIAFDLGRQQPRRAGRAHRGRGARLPVLQLPARVELHGRLRREPARPADGRDRGRGGRQDGRGGVVRAAADPARGAVPGHHLRGAQAAEVPAADLPLRQRALPPPHGAHRLLQQAHDRLPVRLDADARRASRWRCASSPTATTTATSTRAGRSCCSRSACSWWRRASTSSTCSRSSSSGAWTRSACAGCAPRLTSGDRHATSRSTSKPVSSRRCRTPGTRCARRGERDAGGG